MSVNRTVDSSRVAACRGAAGDELLHLVGDEVELAGRDGNRSWPGTVTKRAPVMCSAR